jgi:NitT/TauT family transport system permease protein
LVVGEFFTAQTGLGGLIVRYASDFKTAEMFVPIAVLAAIGYGLTSAVGYLQDWLAPWKKSERDIGV